MLRAGESFVARGLREDIEAFVAFLAKEGVAVKGEDAFVRAYAHFGVGEARELRERASLSSTAGGSRVFIAGMPHLTAEAQNALLKVLEEPPAGARFFLLTPAPDTLLPTLRSRLQQLSFSGETDRFGARAFLAAEPMERLELLKPLLEKGGDERRDMQAILSFLASAESLLAAHPESLPALYRTRKYLLDRGALIRPLLEQFALLTPVIQ